LALAIRALDRHVRGLYYALAFDPPHAFAVLTTGIVPFSLFREAATVASASRHKAAVYSRSRPLDCDRSRNLGSSHAVVVMAVLLGTLAWGRQLHINSWMETMWSGLAAAWLVFGLVAAG